MPTTREDTNRGVLPVYAQRVLSTRITRGWGLRAACATAGVELRDDPDRLMGLCGRCRVRKSCLATALLQRPAGIWAGTTTRQRHQARAAMADGAPPGKVVAHLLATSAAETQSTEGSDR